MAEAWSDQQIWEARVCIAEAHGVGGFPLSQDFCGENAPIAVCTVVTKADAPYSLTNIIDIDIVHDLITSRTIYYII